MTYRKNIDLCGPNNPLFSRLPHSHFFVWKGVGEQLSNRYIKRLERKSLVSSYIPWPPAGGDNPRALASKLSPVRVQVYKPWFSYFIPPSSG